jgi:hypothetical protein
MLLIEACACTLSLTTVPAKGGGRDLCLFHAARNTSGFPDPIGGLVAGQVKNVSVS